LEAERQGNKFIVHNYGHGGAGITMSWGCAQEIVVGTLEASIDFTYENTIEGSVSTAKLSPITAELTGKITPSAEQKAILTFEKPGK
jgi:hypothetical protein